MTTPIHPRVRVELTPYADKSMAVISMVRRALQKAGHDADAAVFTDRALASSPDQLLDLAREWVVVE